MQARSVGGDTERFVAFAFAGANLVVETDGQFRIGYAAGSFRTEFLAEPDSFIGRSLRDLLAPADHEALDAACRLLMERGRLLPMTVRLGNRRHTRLALAGLMLPSADGPPRLCFTLSPLPLPAGGALTTLRTLLRAGETRLREGAAGTLGLVEVLSPGDGPGHNEAVGAALNALMPEAVTTEIVPGRFGVVTATGEEGLVTALRMLERELAAQGLDVMVASTPVSLTADGLTAAQATRALRHALVSFARDGTAGLERAGFAHGLAGYVKRAGTHATALRRAIRAGRFDLAYQPIVTLGSGVVHHYEALIRPLPVPECHMASPQDFILLVETLGLADEVDLTVAQKVCDAAAAERVMVAFNLSGQSAQDPACRVRLLELLSAHPARKSGLVGVEMTETADMDDMAETARTADALRGLGIPFCLDDFGAGAADVRLLRTVRPDIVKLDGSYMAGATEHGRERAFLAGLIEIARAAGAEIVAERIETPDEAEAVRALGAQYGQGWLFGRPGTLPKAPPTAPARRRKGAKESWS